jgi:hypothetical protein
MQSSTTTRVALRVRQPAPVRHRGHPRERDLGLHRRHLRQGCDIAVLSELLPAAEAGLVEAIDRGRSECL